MTHSFLQKLGEAHRKTLSEAAEPFQIGPGGFLAREGQEASAFYLLESGQVSIDSHLIPKRGMVSIQTLGPGDVVGWSWIIEPHRWHFDARAVDEVRGLVFQADWLRQQCEENHTLGYEVLKALTAVIASRLAASRLQCLDIYA